MANKFCSKCGKEVAAGKRFCGACGQPTGAPAVPTPIDASPVLQPAASACTKCGTTIPPGKRFCKQCGHPAGQLVPVTAEPRFGASAVAPVFVGSTCKQCGSALVPGKRFCKSCGHATDAPALVVPVNGNSAELRGPSITETKAFEIPPAVPVSEPAEIPLPAKEELPPIPANLTPVTEPNSTFHAPEEPATVWPSTWESVEPKSPVSPVPAAAFGSGISSTVPRRLLTLKVGIAIGIATAMLAVVAGWALYAHTHSNVSTTAKVPSESQPVTSTPAEQPSKPSPSVSGPSASTAPQSQPKASAPSPERSLPSKVSKDTAQPSAEIARRPEKELPSVPPTSVAPRSGLLHYQGPPVPFNGSVVFDHLPQARLKFNFDRQAWTLTIKGNPDGTKRVTMISQKAGYQANCDLGWEVAE